MNTDELFELVTWVHEKIEVAGIPSLYTTVVQILDQHIQPNSENPSFEEQKINLKVQLEKIDPGQLSALQRELLEKMEILDHVGVYASDIVQDTLVTNAIDPATARARLVDQEAALQRGIVAASAIRNALRPYFAEPDETEQAASRLIRVTFHQGSSAENIVEIDKRYKEWHEICRGVGDAYGISPEEFHIAGVHNGSVITDFAIPMVKNLGTVAQIFGLFTFVWTCALTVAKQYYSTVILQQQAIKAVRENKDASDAVKESLQQAADSYATAAEQIRLDGLKDIQDKVLEKVKSASATTKFSGDPAPIRLATKNLVNFQLNGGGVDLVFKEVDDPEAEEDEANEDLQALENIKQEHRVAVVEFIELQKANPDVLRLLVDSMKEQEEDGEGDKRGTPARNRPDGDSNENSEG